ncbi:MAG: sel1 repeat family protein [Elusimicrobiota bacterium]|jgi:TPR repeat protein|nr:sel1 repeat family protein [Elusimicrobiota bacterium]
MNKTLHFLILSLLFFTAALTAQAQKAQPSLAQLQKAAEQNNTEAQFHLAGLYVWQKEYMKAHYWNARCTYLETRDCGGYDYKECDKIIEADFQKNFEWLKQKADDKNDHIAQFNLGVFYDKGFCLKKDYKKAFYYYSKSAELGNPVSQSNIGTMYYLGQGVQQNYKKAFDWFAKAAEQGYRSDQHNLGLLYYKGHGINQDYKKAFYWFTKSSEQGDPNAQYNLGVLYYNGQGTAKNLRSAYTWYKRAAEQGYTDAMETLKKPEFSGYTKERQ